MTDAYSRTPHVIWKLSRSARFNSAVRTSNTPIKQQEKT
jgi:hypothetical protein